ncbi:MAG: fused MFS/spermidine synthase [Roseiflexaceae bacterium]
MAGTLSSQSAAQTRSNALIVIYTLAIFVSATLLFVVQPMFARMVLPLLGGSPAVWNTALVFYQTALLAGYGYAHLSTRLLGVRRQALLHIPLLLLPLLVLPMAIPAGWTPPADSSPIPWLLALLAAVVGLPFFVVSSSSPLLQKWFAATGHRSAADPYFLYAASNLGSMLALLSYPLILERTLRLREQSQLWSAGYLLLIVLVAGCALALWRSPPATPETVAEQQGAERLAPRRVLRWILLAFVPSSLMTSVTTYISTDIAAIPLLWVVPLALYLLTFILVFASRPPLPQRWMQRAMPLALVPLVFVLLSGLNQPILLIILLHLVAFFVVAMVCHGMLAQDRPPVQSLTAFYMWMSFGGMLGGLFNAIIAPLLFTSIAEYPLVLFVACLVLPGLLPQGRTRLAERLLDVLLPVTLAVGGVILARLLPGMGLGPFWLVQLLGYGLPLLAGLLFVLRGQQLRFALTVGSLLLAGGLFGDRLGNTIYTERSFFGVHRVVEFTLSSSGDYHGLVHGNTLHGTQSRDPARTREPLNYYYSTGPAGQAFAALGERYASQPIAVVGLGAGSLGCYARPGQPWTFYEIDPAVARIARDPALFTFLRDCVPQAQIVLGDARLSLASAPDAGYGMIFLDAYSSDSPPLHLLTREALLLYQSKLAPGGVLLFHMTNRHLDLEAVLGALAQDAGLSALLGEESSLPDAESGRAKAPSRWMIMARNPADLSPLAADPRWRSPQVPSGTPVWTDDFSSLITVLTGR